MNEVVLPDIRRIRAAFPYLDECVYMNTAAAGIPPRGVGAAFARYYDDVRGRGYDGRHAWREYERDTGERLARLLNVPPKNVGFTGSTTESLNLVARSLPVSPAERIVFAVDDFPSVRLAWAPYSASLAPVNIPSEEERTAALAGAIDSRTKVLCVSHVHWATGTCVDLEVLAAACSQHGTLLVVDGAQAAGAMDVDASLADVYTGSTFKWLLSDFGLAYLVIKEDVQKVLEPVFRGYGNEPPSRSLCYAHVNHSAIGLLGTALGYMDSVGWPRVVRRVRDLTDLLHGKLQGAGWGVVTPKAARAGIVVASHPNAAAVAVELSRRGCKASLRDGNLRFSPHFYNTEEDVHRLMAVLTDIR